MEDLKEKNILWQKIKKHHRFLVIVTIGVLFLITGIILPSTYVKKIGTEIVYDYTDCEDDSPPPKIKCKDRLQTEKRCTCYVPITINKTMEAPVTIYYELESYDQMVSNYSNSRDNEQLLGHLSLNPSKSCGAYTYENETKKPIAPCGLLADAMFTDTFSLLLNRKYVMDIRTGLLSEDDKMLYRNPPGNLEQAFKNFSKPINWLYNVWELDTNNPENNGFQNENFIAWMQTDLKRKPAWRVNHTAETEHGIPAANYTLRIEYVYPLSRYDGRRKVIISSKREVKNLVQYGFGIFLLVTGLLLIIVAVIVRVKA